MIRTPWKTALRLAALSFVLFLTSLTSLTARAAGDVTPIGQVQGAEDASPLVGKTVTIAGVVTGDFSGPTKLDGFFVQDKGDGDPKTSDGIFVYISARSKLAATPVKVGDMVQAKGRVTERFGMTELSSLTDLIVTGQGELPKPQEVQLPLSLTDREQLEGMLITFPQTLTVADVYDVARYGTVLLNTGGRLFVATNGQNAAPAMVAAAAAAAPAPDPDADKARELVLDDGSDDQNPSPVPYLNMAGTRRSGDTIKSVTGILIYTHDEYRLEPTVAPAFTDTNPRPVKPPVVGGTIKVASFNMHNYWTTLKSADPTARGPRTSAEHNRQAAKSVKAIQAMDADVVALMEMENNGTATIDDLVTRLNAAYGTTTYARVPDPATGLGTDRIRVAMIYKPAALDLQGPAQSDPDSVFERFPMAQTFVPKNGAKPFTLVANHWKSKGGGPEDANDPNADKGQGAWNVKRVQQAQAVAKFVAQLQPTSPDILVVGDLNAYAGEDPVRELGKSLTYLNARLPQDDRYSFIYAGYSGSLDHAFATPTMSNRIMGLAEWHINADEPNMFDYAARSRAAIPITDETFYRSSDHDPLVIGLK